MTHSGIKELGLIQDKPSVLIPLLLDDPLWEKMISESNNESAGLNPSFAG